MAEQLDEEDLDVCSWCGLSAIVTSRPLRADLVGRGAGPMRAFWRTCSDCERIPERRTPQPGQVLRLSSRTARRVVD